MDAGEIDLTSTDSRRLPLALADLHHHVGVGSAVRVRISRPPPARAPAVADLLEGAGFGEISLAAGTDVAVVDAVRLRSLPDVVDAGMRLLVCGLNPSLHAADAGVGYAGPANRFWPVVREVLGLADRDPHRLLRDHRAGMTDLVKRATPAAASIRPDEYRAGLGRVERLTAWLRPGAVCFVGLGGWRAAGHPRARAGLQPDSLAGRPVYLMPSTSGRNARVTRGALVEHLRRALAASVTRS